MALFTGFFAAAWFGWGQASAPSSMAPWLSAGSTIGLVLAACGVVMAIRNRATAPALADRAALRRYGVIVGTEFGSAALGAVVLGLLGHSAFIPVWVCAVVGVHFVPLAAVLRDRWLIPLAVVTCAVAVSALAAHGASGVAPGTVTGVGEGCVLAAFTLATLLSVAGRAEHD
jgi:hypothetical protein